MTPVDRHKATDVAKYLHGLIAPACALALVIGVFVWLYRPGSVFWARPELFRLHGHDHRYEAVRDVVTRSNRPLPPGHGRILVLGNSMVNEAVDVRRLGRRLTSLGSPVQWDVVTLAYGGAHPADAYLMAKAAWSLKPDLVILGTHARFFAFGPGARQGGLVKRDLLDAPRLFPDLKLLVELYGVPSPSRAIEFAALQSVPMLGLAARLLPLSHFGWREPPPAAYTRKRHINPLDRETMHRRAERWHETTSTWHLCDMSSRNPQVRALRMLSAFCRQWQSPLLVMQMPTHTFAEKSNKDVQADWFADWMRRAGTAGGWQFVDCNHLMPDKYFGDPGHLNQRGCELFTDWLAEYLMTEMQWKGAPE